MIGYVTVGTSDLERAARFYDPLAAELGVGRMMEFDSFIAWGDADGAPGIAATMPFDGSPPVWAMARWSRSRQRPCAGPAAVRHRARQWGGRRGCPGLRGEPDDNGLVFYRLLATPTATSSMLS